MYRSIDKPETLRNAIAIIGNEKSGKGYKKIGEEYRNKWEGNAFNEIKQGYFQTVNTFTDSQQYLNCFAYALGTFGSDLEKLAGKDIKEIQKDTRDIDGLVEKYFTNVSIPKNGDLALYSVSPGKIMYTPHGREVSGTTHAGIYRETELSEEGSVESKWGGFLNPYVFKHEFFFTPDFYGDQVKFYRLKNQL